MAEIALTKEEQREVYQEVYQEEVARSAAEEIGILSEEARKQAEKKEYGALRYYLRMISRFITGGHSQGGDLK